MNTIALLLIVIIATIIIFEFVRHIFVKRIAKFFLIALFFAIVLLLMSSQIKDEEIFKDNKIIQTGAVVAEGLNENLGLEHKFKDISKKDIEETINKNNLFKD